MFHSFIHSFITSRVQLSGQLYYMLMNKQCTLLTGDDCSHLFGPASLRVCTINGLAAGLDIVALFILLLLTGKVDLWFLRWY